MKTKEEYIESIDPDLALLAEELSSELHHEEYSELDVEEFNQLKEYLDKVLLLQKNQLKTSQKKWDSGITSQMNQGCYDMINFYEEVLIELSSFYPEGHFGKESPKDFFDEIISSRFAWYGHVLEPFGLGNGGTMASTMKCGDVMEDVKKMAVDMVKAIKSFKLMRFDLELKSWEKEWLKDGPY